MEDASAQASPRMAMTTDTRTTLFVSLPRSAADAASQQTPTRAMAAREQAQRTDETSINPSDSDQAQH